MRGAEGKLECQDVSVHFGGLKALDKVSTAFQLTGITGLIGPNGAGKTTLINAITNFTHVTGGKVLMQGEDITSRRAYRIARKGVVRTFQIPRTPSGITVHELLDTSIAYTHNAVSARCGLRSAKEIAEFCSIQGQLYSDCGSLSLPQLRRVEIARALSCGPVILMLDEAMAGLSAEDIQDNIELVKKINGLGVGFIVIEHVMSVIRDLCQHTVVLNNGRWLMEGTPEEVFASEAVHQAYVGSDG